MALLATLSAKLRDILNGAGGRPSPIAGIASDILLGDRLNDLADLASVANGKGASLIGVEDVATNFTAVEIEGVLAELYTAATTAGSDVITDTNTYYTVDTVDGGFDALALQVGGLTDATFAFAEQNVLADDDAIYAALEKIDLFVGDLASVANTEGASLIGIEDAAANITATEVEGAVAELAVSKVALGTAPTLTDGGETANVIDVAFASPVASVEQYEATVWDQATGVLAPAVFTMIENGVGAPVSGDGTARLIFTTDAAGAATIDVTDVAAASGLTAVIKVVPLFASADVAQQCAPVVLVLAAFD